MRHSREHLLLGLVTIGGGFGVGGLFYLVDCAVAHGAHPEVSWFKSGLLATNREIQNKESAEQGGAAQPPTSPGSNCQIKREEAPY